MLPWPDVQAEETEPNWCETKPHHNWLYQHDRYYTLLQDAPCRFPDCQAACMNNNGTLAFPHSRESFNTLLSFVNIFTGDAYIGLNLPIYYIPGMNSACTASECNGKLFYSNSSAFKYQDWMNHQFDRAPNQPACFKIKLDKVHRQSLVEPTQCDEPLMAICESHCPRPGVPILPPTIEQQEIVPLETQLMNLEVSRTKRDTNATTTQQLEDFVQVPTSNVNLLDKLPAFPTDPNYGAPATATNHDLVGYDCSIPRELTTVQMLHTENPCGHTPRPVDQRNATYLLLQKSDRLPLTVKGCKITQTIVPYYCGVWSHTVLSPDWLQIEENIITTKEACENLWTTFQWRDPKGKLHQLQPNSTTRIYYNAVGRTEHTQSGPACIGENYHLNGITYTDMVVSVARKFELFQYTATVDDEELLHIPQLAITLPCDFPQLYCKTSRHGTFTWENQNRANMCPYYQTRITKGIVVQDSQERNLYISTDNSMIRLLIQEPISRCGHIIYRTNYEKLFVTSDLTAQTFRTDLPTTEMSVWTYANMQDNYMMGTLTRFIQQEFAAVHQYSCQSSMTRDRFNYDRILAEQHGSTDGDTAALGGGYFLTVAGEAYYRYRCRRVMVRARATEECYSSLPITLQRDDLVKYLHDRQLNTTTSLDFFLEPHSRHISTRGIKMPCSSTFAPLYATAKNSWLRVDPIISIADSPEPLNLKTFHELPLHDSEDWDFEAGGIYTADQIHQHDKHLGIARAVKDVQYTMGQRAQNTGWSSSDHNQRFSFSPNNIIKSIVNFSPWDLFVKFLVDWSWWCSLGIGTYYLIYIWYWLWSCAKTFMFPSIQPATTLERISNAIRRPDFPHRPHGKRPKQEPYLVRYERVPEHRDRFDHQRFSRKNSPPLRRFQSTPSLRYQPAAPPLHNIPRPQPSNPHHQTTSFTSPGTMKRSQYYNKPQPEPSATLLANFRRSPTAFQRVYQQKFQQRPNQSPRNGRVHQNESRRSPNHQSPRHSPRHSPDHFPTKPRNVINSPRNSPPRWQPNPNYLGQLYPQVDPNFNGQFNRAPAVDDQLNTQPMNRTINEMTENLQGQMTGAIPKRNTNQTSPTSATWAQTVANSTNQGTPPPQTQQQHILLSIDLMIQQVNKIIQFRPHLQQNCQALAQQIDMMKRRILSHGLTNKELDDVSQRLAEHQQRLNQMTPAESFYGTTRASTTPPPTLPKPVLNNKA